MSTTFVADRLCQAQQQALAPLYRILDAPVLFYRPVPVELDGLENFFWSVALPGATPEQFTTIDMQAKDWHKLRLTRDVAADLAWSLNLGYFARAGFNPQDLNYLLREYVPR